MAKRMWVLIANASKALCFERDDGAPGLTLLAEFNDPLARSKGSDLADDRAGYESFGRGHRGAAFAPRTDTRTKEHDNFARRLANYLNAGIAAHRCDTLAILASNPFLGAVKMHLDVQSTKALTKTVAKDFTSLAGEELMRRIDHAIPLSR